MMAGGRIAILLLAGCMFQLAGCGYREPEPPRPVDGIFRERDQLPALYLTAVSNRRVIVPGSVAGGCFIDPETGEICWTALSCARPDCPGRDSDGTPYVFVAPDPTVYITESGELDADESRLKNVSPYLGDCPKCLETRDFKSETRQQREQFTRWAVPYALPDSAERLEELNKERQRRLRRDRHRRMVMPE